VAHTLRPQRRGKKKFRRVSSKLLHPTNPGQIQSAVDNNLGQLFPVRIKSILVNVAIHRIKAPNPKLGGHGSCQPMALQQNIKRVSISYEVGGFYAPEALMALSPIPASRSKNTGSIQPSPRPRISTP
jgi:hypothetical protein